MAPQHEPPSLTSLCVFCGSASGGDPAHGAAAAHLGRRMAAENVRLVYGGGHVGIMGTVAEAVLAGGGEVIGIIPEHLTRAEQAFLSVSRLIVVDSMHTRKRRMFDMADAVAVLPGGMGTMDEFFEILTWKQLRLHNKPIIILNQHGYWDRLLALIDGIIAAGFARPVTGGLFTVVTAPEEVLPAARRDLEAVLESRSELF